MSNESIGLDLETKILKGAAWIDEDRWSKQERLQRRGVAEDSYLVDVGHAHHTVHTTCCRVRQTDSRSLVLPTYSYLGFFFWVLPSKIDWSIHCATGFPDLSQDDQLILIKVGFFEVWLGHVTRLVNVQDGTLTLSDGATISRHQLESIFDVSFLLNELKIEKLIQLT